jgi:hypothetical protein
VRPAASAPVVRLVVGLSDGLSKLAAHALLQPVLETPALRLVCHEGEVGQLLGELAMHQPDLVLACQSPPPSSSLRLSSERLVQSPVDWYGPAALVDGVQAAAFPAVLSALPLLLPTTHYALRHRLERWFDARGIVPRVVGEFEDSALLSVFAAQGTGAFPACRLGASDVALMSGLRLLGSSPDLHEEIHAIGSRRSLHHIRRCSRCWRPRGAPERAAGGLTDAPDGAGPAGARIPGIPEPRDSCRGIHALDIKDPSEQFALIRGACHHLPHGTGGVRRAGRKPCAGIRTRSTRRSRAWAWDAWHVGRALGGLWRWLPSRPVVASGHRSGRSSRSR